MKKQSELLGNRNKKKHPGYTPITYSAKTKGLFIGQLLQSIANNSNSNKSYDSVSFIKILNYINHDREGLYITKKQLLSLFNEVEGFGILAIESNPKRKYKSYSFSWNPIAKWAIPIQK